MIALPLTLSSIPTPTAFVAVQAGEAWRFQVWHRDGGGSNFTDAVEVVFQP